MRKMLARRGSLVVVALGTPLLLGTGSCPHKDVNPIIFVHGGSGSGAQFESQAMRFTSNGYLQDYIRVLEYDSSVPLVTNPANMALVHASLDALIADLQADTGEAQVDLMGHSLGTAVSQTYLSTPARAANVAHYVNIDGGTAGALPGGVPTLALWAGRGTPGREIVGATNVTLPDQSHVETATSEEAFFEMYQFLQGKEPLTTHILPTLRPKISGRATNFPANTGLDGATLAIWWVNGETGERIGSTPRETFAIGPDGNWGPFKSWFGLHYEFELTRPGEVTINYYYEPFLRDDHLVRLNVAGGLAPFITSSPNHTALTVVRFREFWGDQGVQNDVLEIDGLDIISPTAFASNSTAAASVSAFLFDFGLDMVSNVPGPVPFPFGPLAFLTAQDLFLPTDPEGSISVHVVPRGVADDAVTVNVPNLPSSTNRMVVQLNDFEQ